MIKQLNIFVFFLLASVFAACNEDNDSSINQGLPEAPLSLELSDLESKVYNSAGQVEILVKNNGGWKAEKNAPWVSLSITEGLGYSSIKIHYEENTTERIRQATVRFTSSDGTLSRDFQLYQSNQWFANPLAGIPDPWLIKQGNSYYTCKAGDGIYLSKSDKMSVVNSTKRVWATPKDIETPTDTTRFWNIGNVWAPELHYIEGNWYVYYAAGRPRAEEGRYQQRSGVLRAKTSDPMGEWEDLGILYTGDEYTPGIVTTKDNTTWAIDLTTFVLNGQRYAVWSGLPDDVSSEQMLYIAKMDNPYTISSNRVMISRPDQPWELINSKINEGPAFLRSPDGKKAFIVYSSNGSWTKYYRLAYLMIDTDKDPMVAANWQKSPNEVFYRCDESPVSGPTDGVNGVGHCCFTKSADETEDWIVYHTKKRNDPSYDSGRAMYINKIDWDENGMPVFGTPPGYNELLLLPSGESN